MNCPNSPRFGIVVSEPMMARLYLSQCESSHRAESFPAGLFGLRVAATRDEGSNMRGARRITPE